MGKGDFCPPGYVSSGDFFPPGSRFGGGCVCFSLFVVVCSVQTGDSWSRTVVSGGCW